MTEVYITGVGVVSALGLGLEVQYEKLRTGSTGITFYEGPGPSCYAGRVPWDNRQLCELIDVSYSRYYSRTALLGIAAARQALAGLVVDARFPTSFLNGSTVGGMDLSEGYFEAKAAQRPADPRVFGMHDLGGMTAWMAGKLGAFHAVQTLSTACSSGANALMLGAQLIRSGRADRVLAGGTESFCRFTLEGFRSLMVYDPGLCRPFDTERKGLNLGEGAAYLLLESESSLQASGNKPLARLSGWANRNDAFHHTGTSPTGIGAQLAMQAALEQAGLLPGAVSYINAHGTGTATNDASELAAMQEIFGRGLPYFSSTKGATGHTLGASGAIEAAFAVKSILAAYAYGTVGLHQPMDASESLLASGRETPVREVMSNSFGFGGNATSLIFSEVP